MAYINTTEQQSANQKNVKFRMGYEIVSQGISGGTAYSLLNVRVQTRRTHSETTTNKSNAAYTVGVDATTYSGTMNYNVGQYTVNVWNTIYERTSVTVNHTPDGTKDLPLHFYINLSGTSASYADCNWTVTLPAIAMGSSVSVDSGSYTISDATGPTATATIDIHNLDYYHRITWAIGSYTVSTNLGKFNSTPQTSTRVLTASNWLPQMPNSISGTGTCTLQTFSDSGYTTQIGSDKVATFTVVCGRPPTLGSVTSACAGSYIGTTYISGFSCARITGSSAAGINGSTITTYEFIQNGISQATVSSSASTYSWTSSVLTAGSHTFDVKITDSRGLTATKSVTISVEQYATPSLSAEVFRCNSSGTRLNEGTYINVTVNATATPSVNSISSLKLYTKLTSASTYTDKGALTNGASNVKSGYPVTDTFDIRIEAIDALGQVAPYVTKILTAQYTADFKAGGLGIAFGKVAQNDEQVDSAWQIRSIAAGSGSNAGLVSESDTANTEVAVSAQRSDTGNGVSLKVGANGVDRGVYIDGTGDGWLAHYNGTGLSLDKNVVAAGKLVAGQIDFSIVNEYYETDTTTTSSAMVKSYTADDYGVVIASVSVMTDNTSNFGTTSARVTKNSTTYAYSANRLDANSTTVFGANAVAVMSVTQGDVIETRCASSKTGTKTGYFNLLAIGCNLTGV